MIYNREWLNILTAIQSIIHQYFLAKEGEEKLEIKKKISKKCIFISTHYNKPWTNTAGPWLRKHKTIKGCYTKQQQYFYFELSKAK